MGVLGRGGRRGVGGRDRPRRVPDDIDVLYVVGLGNGEYEPARLFEAHEAAGSLGLLAPGTPTNTVDGAPAADLGRDADAWLDAMASPTPPSSAR